ncbi:hypothetical protein AAMO2058_001429400 [Amorphochlora amoebiformis]
MATVEGYQQRAPLERLGKGDFDARGKTGKFAAVIYYLGTNFHGFQSQDNKNLITVQDALEQAIVRVAYVSAKDRQRVVVTSAGRTDTGVHASGQVIHFYLSAATTAKNKNRLEAFREDLNKTLYESNHAVYFRFLRFYPVGTPFHARMSVSRKRYAFYISQGLVRTDWLEYAQHVIELLDVQAMRH